MYLIIPYGNNLRKTIKLYNTCLNLIDLLTTYITTKIQMLVKNRCAFEALDFNNLSFILIRTKVFRLLFKIKNTSCSQARYLVERQVKKNKFSDGYHIYFHFVIVFKKNPSFKMRYF